MNHGSESPELPPAGEPIDPYSRLGIAPDASFDAVQAAKQARLEEVGEDPLARSRIEAAYDAVLMDRLKELAELKTAGLISEDEFNGKKADLMKQL